MPRPPRSLTPAHQQQWLDQLNAALQRGDMGSAGRLAVQAVSDGADHVMVLKLAASARFDEGRFAEAEQLLRRARVTAPRDPHVLNSLGVCLNALGQNDAALKAYDAAIRLDPDLAEAHFNRGATLDDMGDITRARAAYQAAIALNARYVEPLASLAWLDAKAGDAVSARTLAERALGLSRADALARMAMASASLTLRNHDAATVLLVELEQDSALTPVNRSIVLGMIGDLLDAQGNAGEAFGAYEAANDQLRAIYRSSFERPGVETALAQARRLGAWFEAAAPEPWREAPEARPRAADPHTHVFLVGFPRSGTTLLETVLAAHPEVVSLEEKGALDAARATFVDSDDGLDRLAAISSAEAHRQREAYWKAVRGFGVEPRGRLFIDKMPLASVDLPLIAKLFPAAKVLFAQRDPRDVVLSCFRRRFGINRSMYQLLTLEGAADYYDAVMRLAERYRTLLPIPQHIVRYESLVDDFETTTSAVCDFLGLEWTEAMADIAATARARAISTPSAEQLAQGLNREGLGVWRRYEAHMAPVQAILAPWVERFGYDPA